MSSLFTHIFIPAMVLILFSKKLGIDPKEALVLSLFAALPDVDHVFLTSRATLHSIFLLLIPLLVFILVKGRRDISGMICFYIVSHLILDMFNKGVYLLYPVYNKVFYANAELLSNHGSFLSVVNYGIVDKIGMGDKIISMSNWGIVISDENVGTAILLIVIATISFLRTSKRK